MTDGLSGDVGISIGTAVRVWRINISSMRPRGFLGDGRHRLTRFQSRDIKSGDGGVDSDNKGKPRVQENYSRPLKSMTTRFRNVGQLAASHQNIVLSHAPSPLFDCNMPAITSLLLQRGSSVSAPSSPELCPRVSVTHLTRWPAVFYPSATSLPWIALSSRSSLSAWRERTSYLTIILQIISESESTLEKNLPKLRRVFRCLG